MNGHADRVEGPEAQTWQLSLRRAQAAISVLREDCKIHPSLLEAAGRGAFEPALNRGQASGTRVAEANRRLEIVIVYSGNISLLYLQGQRRHETHGL